MSYIECMVRNCNGRGLYMPTIMLFADRSYGKDVPPIRLTFHKPHCQECRDMFLLERFLTEDVKASLLTLFEDAGKARPDWRKTKLIWEDFREAPPPEQSVLARPLEIRSH